MVGLRRGFDAFGKGCREVTAGWVPVADSFAIAFEMIGSRWDRSGLRSAIRGGGDDKWLLMTTAALESSNGGFPVRSWNAVAASAYWSVRPSNDAPMSCSGGA